jgi:hypothetical protein
MWPSRQLNGHTTIDVSFRIINRRLNMSSSNKQSVQNRKQLESKVAAAKHMSKPDAENTIVVRDANGRWIFEVYPAGHTVKRFT